MGEDVDIRLIRHLERWELQLRSNLAEPVDGGWWKAYCALSTRIHQPGSIDVHRPGRLCLVKHTPYFVGMRFTDPLFQRAMLVLMSPSTARKFHSSLLRVVMRAPQSFFTTEIGVILNRFSQDMTLIENQLAIGVLVTISNLFLSAATAGLVAAGSSYMALSVPVLILTIGALQHVYLRTSRQLRLLDLEARSPL